MKTIFIAFAAMLALITISCQTKETDSYPSIFMVNKKSESFKSVDDLKNIDRQGHQGVLWDDFMSQVESELTHPFIDLTTDFEGRDPAQLKHANLSYDMENGISKRLMRLSLMFLLTEEAKYKDLVMKQIEVLYDTTYFPEWCDKSHYRHGMPRVDIRTCRISMAVSLSYNWMHNFLSEEEKNYIIEGLDRRAIQPFWKILESKPRWYTHRHNWFTNIFGGMGITAMALNGAHPETQQLLDTIVPQMIDFNNTFGKMGEFNEPPGYSAAVRFSVEFAEAYRYYTKNKRNLLSEKPFPEVCYWIMYHTLPSGRLIAFGDTNPNSKLSSPEIMAAAATANNDMVLQWFYLNYFEKMKTPMELLWFNPELEMESPQGKFPLGIAYQEHGADLISRTSWDPVSTHCVVYGKAGRETNHDDNDVGQLCIDGFGKKLIIDPGKPEPIYPKGYFGEPQYNYYTRSVIGHNILCINNEEIKSEPNEQARGKIIKTWFNDTIGSYWAIDLTPVYPNAEKVTRKVVHLFPGIVAVHDYARVAENSHFDLRWHCNASPHLSEFDSGSFTTRNSQSTLVGKLVSFKNNLDISTGHHEFKPPFHLSRLGDPLEQDYEPFVKISTRGNEFSVLSLFSVSETVVEEDDWNETQTGWRIVNKHGSFHATINDNTIVLSDSRGNKIEMN
jgi:hypothetical protein